MRKKLLICLIILVSIIVLACIIISVFPKEYSITKDQWESTPYVVLNYGKYLGKYWGNGTYSYYQIKDLATEDWIYEGHGAIVPMNFWEGTVYRKKGVSIEPIEQWNVNRILISSRSKIQQGKENYVIDNQIIDANHISTLLDARNSKPEENINGLKELVPCLLFVFDECSGLAWKCSVFQSADLKYFIMVDDNYYSAECLKSYIG